MFKCVSWSTGTSKACVQVWSNMHLTSVYVCNLRKAVAHLHAVFHKCFCANGSELLFHLSHLEMFIQCIHLILFSPLLCTGPTWDLNPQPYRCNALPTETHGTVSDAQHRWISTYTSGCNVCGVPWDVAQCYWLGKLFDTAPNLHKPFCVHHSSDETG